MSKKVDRKKEVLMGKLKKDLEKFHENELLALRERAVGQAIYSDESRKESYARITEKPLLQEGCTLAEALDWIERCQNTVKDKISPKRLEEIEHLAKTDGNYLEE